MVSLRHYAHVLLQGALKPVNRQQHRQRAKCFAIIFPLADYRVLHIGVYQDADVCDISNRLGISHNSAPCIYKETRDIFDIVCCERLQQQHMEAAPSNKKVISIADLQRIAGLTSAAIQAFTRFTVRENITTRMYLCKNSSTDDALSITPFTSRADNSMLLYILLNSPDLFTGGRTALAMQEGVYAPYRMQGESLAFASCIPHGMMRHLRLVAGNKYELCVETGCD